MDLRGYVAHSAVCMWQVAYRAPGNQQADWVDLYNRLYRERILFLGQQIDDEITNQVRVGSLASPAPCARCEGQANAVGCLAAAGPNTRNWRARA